MANIAATNKFNNLLFSTYKTAISDIEEHKAGHTGLDLRPKRPARPEELLRSSVAQLNGKKGDFVYEPTIAKSRPYFGYDAKIDTTILDCIRDKFVDVSGVLIPNRELKSDGYVQETVKPLRSYKIIS